MGEEERELRRRLGAFAQLSGEDLAGLLARRKAFLPGQDMVRQGQPQTSIYLLAQGWAFSAKLIPSGSRQIASFHIPGDLLGLRCTELAVSDQTVTPVTPVEAVELTISELADFLPRLPNLARALLRSMARDEAILLERLASLGHRTALERTAHLMLELATRLSLAGLGSRSAFACPLTQYHIADALGLSAIHVNRMLRQLREDGLLHFRRGRVTIPDFESLSALVGFSPDFLDL